MKNKLAKLKYLPNSFTILEDGVNNTQSFVGLFNSKAGTLFGKLDKYIKKSESMDLDS